MFDSVLDPQPGVFSNAPSNMEQLEKLCIKLENSSDSLT